MLSRAGLVTGGQVSLGQEEKTNTQVDMDACVGPLTTPLNDLWKRMLTNKCGKVSCCKLKKVTQAFVQFGFLTPKSKCPTWIRSQQGARRRNRKNRTPGASTGASRVSLDLGRHKVDTVTRRAMPGVRKV